MAETIFRDIVQDVLQSLVTAHHDSGIKRHSLSQRNSVRAIVRGLVLAEMFIKVQITKNSISGRRAEPCSWVAKEAEEDYANHSAAPVVSVLKKNLYIGYGFVFNINFLNHFSLEFLKYLNLPVFLFQDF